MAYPSNQQLQGQITSLQRRYFEERAPKAAGIAPIRNPVGGLGRSFQYTYVTLSGDQLYKRGGVMSKGDSLQRIHMEIARKTFELSRWNVGQFDLDEATANAFIDTQDLTPAFWTENLMSQLYKVHCESVLDEAIASLDSEALDLTALTFERDLAALMTEIGKTGVRPNTIALGPEALDVLSTATFVANRSSLAASNGNVYNGSPRVDRAGLAAYFRSAFGLNLVEIDTTAGAVDSSDEIVVASDYIFSDKGILGVVGGERGYDTLFTAVSNIGPARNKVVDVEDYIGFSVQCEGDWHIEPANPETGIVLDLNLGS